MACTTAPLPSRPPTGMAGGSPRKRKGRKGVGGGNGVSGVADGLDAVNGVGERLVNGSTATTQERASVTSTHIQAQTISAQTPVNGTGRPPSVISKSPLRTPAATHTSTPTTIKKKKSKGPGSTITTVPSLPAMPSEPPPLPPPPSLPPPPLPPTTTLGLSAGGHPDEVEGEDAEEHLDVSLRRIKGLPKRRRFSSGGALTLATPTSTSATITLAIPSSMGMGWEKEDERLANGLGNSRGNSHGPGNTKKRKVPANAASPTGSSGWFAANPSADGDTIPNPTTPSFASDSAFQQHPEQSYFPLQNSTTPSKPFPGQMDWARRKRGRGYAASLAASHLREVMRLRKRQLGAVLGRLEKGDVEGVDEVLMGFGAGKSASYDREEEGKVRKNRRRGKGGSSLVTSKEVSETSAVMGEFTFVVESATSERLLKTKEEVAKLRERFETELERQAGRLAKAKGKSKSSRLVSTTVKAMNAGTQQGRKKISNPTSTTTQTTTASPQTITTSSTTTIIPTAPLPPGGGKKKKKKRSALANASNPHHLRNYVPSRIPGAGSASTIDGDNGGMIWPLALTFLSADVGSKRNPSTAPIPSSIPPSSDPFQSPSDEWICPFCEYDLFFSEDDGSFRRAVANRKKVLGRRKRARERVNRVGAGAGGANGLGKVEEEGEEGEEDDCEEGVVEEEGGEARADFARSVGARGGESRGWKGGT